MVAREVVTQGAFLHTYLVFHYASKNLTSGKCSTVCFFSHLLIAFRPCTLYSFSACTWPNFHCPFEVQDSLPSPEMFKSAVRKSNPTMDPPPPYDVSPPTSQRNSTDFTQLDEAEAETEPLTSNAPTTGDSSAPEHQEIPVQQHQYNRGCCNIMSEDGCFNVLSTGGCCNWESTGGCCNIR